MAAAKKNLVIVESPSKAKTIGKFLGSRYKVIASVGHVRDLPKSKLGIDIENDFEPQYISIRGKGDVIKELKKEAKAAAKVYLATDPDRCLLYTSHTHRVSVSIFEVHLFGNADQSSQGVEHIYKGKGQHQN